MNIARTVTEAPASPAVTASFGASPMVLLAVLLVVLVVVLLLLLVVLDALLLVAVIVLDVACSPAAGCGTRTVRAPGNFQESPNKPLPKPPWM